MRPGPVKRALILDLSGISSRAGAAGRASGVVAGGRGGVGAVGKKKARPSASARNATRCFMGRNARCVPTGLRFAEVEETRTDLVEATGRPEPNGKTPEPALRLVAGALGLLKRQLRRAAAAVEAIGKSAEVIKPGWARACLVCMEFIRLVKAWRGKARQGDGND